MNLLNKDINQILFDTLSLQDKYNFYKYCIKDKLNDELIYIENYFESLHNISRHEWIEIIISNEGNLHEDLLHKYKENLDWYIVCIYHKLSEKFILNHREYINWRPVVMHQQITKPILDLYWNDLDWGTVSSSRFMTEELIEKYNEKIDWNYIKLDNPSDDFLNKYCDKINWSHITFNNLERYSQYEEHVDWTMISYHEKLPEDFIRKHQDKLDWNFLSSNQQLSNEFINEFKDKLNMGSIEMFRDSDRPRRLGTYDIYDIPRHPLPLVRQSRYRPNRPSFFEL